MSETAPSTTDRLLLGSAPVRPGEWTPLLGAQVEVMHNDDSTLRVHYRFEPQRIVAGDVAKHLPLGSVIVAVATPMRAAGVALLRTHDGWIGQTDREAIAYSLLSESQFLVLWVGALAEADAAGAVGDG